MSEISPVSSNKPPVQPPKQPVEKKKPEAHEHGFVALNNSLQLTDLQFGVLPVNDGTDRLLLSAHFIQQRAPKSDNVFDQKHKQFDYAIEPQYQRKLNDGWDLYARLPLTVRGGDTENEPSMDLMADVTIGRHWDKNLFRFEYGANNLNNAGEASQFITFTPYHRFDLVDNYLTLRTGLNYSCNIAGDKASHTLTIETKLAGMIKSDPWSGWGIQAFVPIALDRQLPEWRKRVDLTGVYAWMGTVLPENWFGKGFFLEGGIWIGGHIHESDNPGQDLAAGVNLKLKWGNEARWWP